MENEDQRLNRYNRLRLRKIISKVRMKFLGLDWYLTDHPTMHSERVVRLIRQITSNIDLNQEELFLLYASAWLHDIGYPIWQSLEAARHMEEFLEEVDSTLSLYLKATSQTAPRMVHNELAKLYILTNSKDLGLKKIEAEILSEICFSHARVSFEKLLKLPERVVLEGEEVRVLLIASLLRLVDALDIEFSRLWASTNSTVGLEIDSKNREIKIRVRTIQRNQIESIIEHQVGSAIEETNGVLFRYNLGKFSLRLLFIEISDPPLTAQVLNAMLNDAYLQNLMNYVENNENRLKEKLADRGRTVNDFTNRFLNFKRWNSTSPIYSSVSSLGGGYFLIWRHRGIVVDPGYDYVTSFIKAFNILDIDAVIVTHDHPDHCNDIPRILNLLHEVNRIKRQRHQRAHRIEFYVSLGVHHRYGEMLRSEPNALETTIIPGDPIPLSRFGLDARSTRTRHLETIGQNTGFGVRLRSTPSRVLDIGITGDTAYFPDLESEFDGARILVVHIGRFRDLMTHGFSDIHLSFPGIVTLVSLLSRTPDLVIVSEFGEETRGDHHRKEVCEKLEQHIMNQGRNVRCVPADANMCIKLERGRLKVGRAEIDSYHSIANLRVYEDPSTDIIYYYR